MLRLISSLVLVLLVCEGDGSAQLARHDLHFCLLVAGDSKGPNLGVLWNEEVNGINLKFQDVEKNVTFQGLSKSFDHPISFIEVFDLNCLSTNLWPRVFAQIVSGGVGERQVSIKFTLTERSRYDFVVVIRGKPV